MITTRVAETCVVANELRHHIQERTFGRLHELTVNQLPDGRINVSAIAHSRFVGQLAEWAVLEQVESANVDLSICVRIPSLHLIKDQK